MCFHSKQSKDAQALKARFNAEMVENGIYTPTEYYNGFDYPKTPIITNKTPDKIHLYHWGLLPSWAKDLSFRLNTLNAKIETVHEKPSFKESILRRCLVLVDGFYEWQWLDSKGNRKQKYLLSMPNGEAFAMAGLYNEFVDRSTGEIIPTYTILTTEANKLMAEIHNTKKRMPVILTPENEGLWLANSPIPEFIKPEIELQATKIQ
jgi:putative SOS response-associated peptidase YedK